MVGYLKRVQSVVFTVKSKNQILSTHLAQLEMEQFKKQARIAHTCGNIHGDNKSPLVGILHHGTENTLTLTSRPETAIFSKNNAHLHTHDERLLLSQRFEQRRRVSAEATRITRERETNDGDKFARDAVLPSKVALIGSFE